MVQRVFAAFAARSGGEWCCKESFLLTSSSAALARTPTPCATRLYANATGASGAAKGYFAKKKKRRPARSYSKPPRAAASTLREAA